MTLIFDFLIGVLSAVACVWFGFYLGRLERDESPAVVSFPESFDGAVLDAAEYPYGVDDE